MHRCNAQPPRFSVEPLEDRLLLAGNVTARLNGNNLLVYGDVNSNVLAITSGSVAGSIVVTGLTDSQGKPTKINGQSNGSVQFNRVTGSLFADLGRGLDVLGLTNLKITRDVKITDELGEANIFIGRDSTPDSATPLHSVKNGPVSIGGDLAIVTGPGADRVEIGDIGFGPRPIGASVTVNGSIQISLGAGAGPGTPYVGPYESVRIGRVGESASFDVSVGKDVAIDLGSGSSYAQIRSMKVVGSLDVVASNIGNYISAGVVVGTQFNVAAPLALQVGGDVNINLGLGPEESVQMFGFSVAGNLNLNLPGLARYITEGISDVYLYGGQVGGELNIVLGTAESLVSLYGVRASRLSIQGSTADEFIEIGSTEDGRRCVFDTVAIELGGGRDYLAIDHTTVNGLAVLDGGSGDDDLYIDPVSVVGGQFVRISF